LTQEHQVEVTPEGAAPGQVVAGVEPPEGLIELGVQP
jgi:hypothetical protein